MTSTFQAKAMRRPPREIAGLRWWIIGLVFLITLINFVNRLAVAVLGPVLTAQLGLSATQFAELTTCFLVAYTVSQGLSGKLYDVIGTRTGFVVSVIVWSLASMAHAFARGLTSLNILRFVLGLGEGGNWPGAAKVIAEWFPKRERAFAMGICNSGTALGTVIATPLIAWIDLKYGWRSTFLAIGILGLVWLVLWLFLYQSPSNTSRITAAEAQLISSDRELTPALRPIPWGILLRRQEFWAIVVARFFGDPVWWLYITWLPLYLYRVRHFSLREIGLFAWIPFVAADAGSLFGGWLAGWLITRHWEVNRARRAVFLMGMVLMSCGIPVAMVRSPISALALIATVLFGFQSWIGNVQTLPSDFFPEQAVGTVMGMGGVGAGVGAMLLTAATGFVVDHYSYTPILVVAGLLPILATIVLFAWGKPSQKN